MKFLKEGLGSPNYASLNDNLDKAGDHEVQHKSGIFKFASSNSRIDLIKSQIKEWDKNNLTQNFSNFLTSRIDDNGWNKRDPFLNWLEVTHDNNIKYLNDDTAEKLAQKLDGGLDMKYLGESLFSESDKDFEYKLNLIKILTTPREAKKFTNDSGETPNISMIQDDKKDYLTASEMKQRMDSFTSDIDEDNLISLRQWFNDIKCTDKKSQYKFLNEVLKKQYPDNKNYPKWASGLHNIFNDDEKKYKNLLNECDIDKNIEKEDTPNIIEALNNYFDSIGTLNFSTKYNNLIDALNARKLGSENAYKFLRDILNKSKFKSDIPIFDKLWATEKYKNDILKSPIQSDSKGNIKWSSFIHKYITDSKLPANITGSKVLGIDGAPIKK